MTKYVEYLDGSMQRLNSFLRRRSTIAETLYILKNIIIILETTQVFAVLQKQRIILENLKIKLVHFIMKSGLTQLNMLVRQENAIGSER